MRKRLRVSTISIVIIALALASTAATCSPQTRHQVYQVDAAISRAVFALQDAERLVWQEQVPGYTRESHLKALEKIKVGLQACDAMNHAVMAYKPGGKLPLEIQQATAALTATSDLVMGFLPPTKRLEIEPKVRLGLAAITGLIFALTAGG